MEVPADLPYPLQCGVGRFRLRVRGGVREEHLAHRIHKHERRLVIVLAREGEATRSINHEVAERRECSDASRA